MLLTFRLTLLPEERAVMRFALQAFARQRDTDANRCERADCHVAAQRARQDATTALALVEKIDPDDGLLID